MEMKHPIVHLLEQLECIIEKLYDKQYTAPVSLLSNATIGQHARHVIDFFLELDKRYDDGILNYDKTKRDCEIESNSNFAFRKLDEIRDYLPRAVKHLLPSVELNSEEHKKIEVKTKHFSAVNDNPDPTVHHMAFMRIGVATASDILLPEKFGVAASTIKFRMACAQ